MLSSYKKSLLFEDRLRKANLLIAKYPGRVPVICEKYQGNNNPDIDKNKYLVPVDITIGQFLIIIRQRIKLNPNESNLKKEITDLLRFSPSTVEKYATKDITFEFTMQKKLNVFLCFLLK